MDVDLATLTPNTVPLLNADDFEAVVLLDIKRKASNDAGLSEGVVAALRTSEVIDRWLCVLRQRRASVDGQLGARKADYLASQSLLRLDIVRFSRPLKAGSHGHRDPDSGRVLYRPELSERIASLQMRLLASTHEYAKSRAAILRFKTGLDIRIAEAQYLAMRDHSGGGAAR